MDLFNPQPQETINILPHNGIVNYFGKMFTLYDANIFYEQLLNSLTWENDKAIIYGKTIITKRKVAWYGSEAYPYTYSKVTKTALPFTNSLLQIKNLIEAKTGETFNSCLCNLYHNGSEGMAWHSDAEKDLKKNGAIASVSFGAERKFAFKNKATNEVININLAHGSLLIMKHVTQTYWLHRLPPTTKINTPRINLTFRTIVKV